RAADPEFGSSSTPQLERGCAGFVGGGACRPGFLRRLRRRGLRFRSLGSELLSFLLLRLKLALIAFPLLDLFLRTRRQVARGDRFEAGRLQLLLDAALAQ